MPNDEPKYLIVGPSWVGDMVMAQSLFIDLRDRFPNATIDVLAPQWTAALIDRMPEVDNLVATPFQHGKLSLGDRWRLGKQLRAKAYTHAIVLPNSIKAALVPAFANIPHRCGFLGEQRWGLLNDVRKLDKQALPMTVQRFVILGRPADNKGPSSDSLPTPALQVDTEQAKNVIAKFSLDSSSNILALCPGAEFGSSKKWPARFYAHVARHYLAQSWQVWLLGSDSDLSTCKEIDALTDGKTNVLAGRTSLPEAVDLLSQASLVVSNDSGLMHIAAGLQTPLVAVYGSTDPGHTPPLSKNHRIAKIKLECAPCFKRECPLLHHHCMEHLPPQQVVDLANEVLS